MTLKNINERIYAFFNSRDIAEHCHKIGYQFTPIETAYIVWHSNHHSLEEKHNAWYEIINTLPDEQFRSNWDFEGYTLHSFLRTYMCLQNEFIKDFCTTKEGYIYSYATLQKYEDCYRPDDIIFDSYDACLDALKTNEIDDDTYDEIAKVKIIRHKLYSSQVSFRDAQEQESIIFDKKLCPFDIESAYESEGEKRFLSPSNGFYEMWIAIPTPFRKGDIVMDVDVYIDYTKRHRPFILERIPYWRRNSDNGENCAAEVERLLNLGVDWTDMQECVYLQDGNGEIYWDHAFNYLDMEYYREELCGTEKFLTAVSSAMQGKINVEDLLRSHSIVLMENYTLETHRYFGDNSQLIKLCGLEKESKYE